MISNTDNFSFKEGEWRLDFKFINNPANGKKVGFFRLDDGEVFKMWEEKDFLDHINKLKAIND